MTAIMYPELASLLQRAQNDRAVLAVMLFGSEARGEAGPASDLDVCLILPPGRDGKAEQAAVREAYLHISGERLDLRVFQQLPLYVRRRVLKEGRVLACRDEDALYEVARRTAQAYEDYRPQYHRHLETIARAGS